MHEQEALDGFDADTGSQLDRSGPDKVVAGNSTGQQRRNPAPDLAVAAPADAVPDHPGRRIDDGATGSQVELQHLTISTAWTGMLPPPEAFEAYPDHVQARILAWQDDQTIGESVRTERLVQAESQRQDRLVESSVRVAERGQFVAALLYLLSLAGCVVLAWRGNNVGAGIALAPSVLGFLSRYLPAGGEAGMGRSEEAD